MTTAGHAHLEDWVWAQTVVRFTKEIPPESVVQSVRIVAWSSPTTILVCRDAAGSLFLPGGNMEPGEDPKGCLVRELFEETGWRPSEDTTWFGAHVGLSYHDRRYREHSPFPLKAWLWGSVRAHYASAPTNPHGAERVVEVIQATLPVAASLLREAGRGYITALQQLGVVKEGA